MNCSHSKADSDDRQPYPIDPGWRCLRGFAPQAGLFGCSIADSERLQHPRNLMQQAQNEINIALPSIAPLVDRVTPAVVNISVELKARTAAEDESDTGDESALLFRPGSTPFDQFLHRLLE